nr:LIM domain-binding protein 3 isoform X2 [Leptinotarsa decemlineata]
MATHPRLVNKQFNSPIGLYSAQNVQEVLERETQILANGAVGINFHNPAVGKPANLQKSAVLRMLEEEESRQRNGFEPSSKRVAWPPPNESGPDSPYVEQNSVSAKGGPQYPSQSPGLQQNNYQPAQQRQVSPNPIHHRSPLKPLDVSAGGSSPLASPQLSQGPQGYRPSTPSKGWAPVHSPVSTPTQPSWQAPSSQAAKFQAAHQPVSQPVYLGQQYQTSPQPYKPVPNQYQSSQQYQSPPKQFQAPQYPSKPEVALSQVTKPVEPPPSTITLRSAAPVSQASPPVFNSQPATATLKGGKHLRGDLKWPPENVKSQAEEENRLRLELAKGPVFRPKRPNKDYTSFFAQHALNSTYPGYKIPPGTQFVRPE